MKKRILNYRPDLPDHRDHYHKPAAIVLPPVVDLSNQMTRVEDQGDLGSCVAHGVTALFENLDFRRDRRYLNRSRLQVYYCGRTIEGTVREDSGLYVRDGMKALAKFGAARETLWRYDVARFRVKPTKAVMDDAARHQALEYRRVDQTRADFIGTLAEGHPIAVGFSVYDSFLSDAVAKTGIVPMPSRSESLQGGHCVAAVGYDLGDESVLCKNSWGKGWGLKDAAHRGYFRMPLAYLLDGDLAEDFWMLTSAENIK